MNLPSALVINLVHAEHTVKYAAMKILVSTAVLRHL